MRESANDLKCSWARATSVRLTEYLDNVREIERRIVRAEQQRDETGIEAPPTPVGIPENWEEHVKLMFELMALAYQGNLTRVVSFMMARELSTLSYPQIGVADGHHPVSHNNNIPEQVAKKIKVDIYHLDLFAQFLDKLRATPDGDGSLLDHSLFLYGSGMTNGNAARPREPADAARRRRRGQAQGQPPHQDAEEHAAVEPDDLDHGQGGHHTSRSSARARAAIEL